MNTWWAWTLVLNSLALLTLTWAERWSRESAKIIREIEAKYPSVLFESFLEINGETTRVDNTTSLQELPAPLEGFDYDGCDALACDVSDDDVAIEAEEDTTKILFLDDISTWDWEPPVVWYRSIGMRLQELLRPAPARTPQVDLISRQSELDALCEELVHALVANRTGLANRLRTRAVNYVLRTPNLDTSEWLALISV